MLAPVLIDPPAIAPVTLAEVKAALRIEHDDDDALLTTLVGAATRYLDGYEGVLGRCLVEQTWRQVFNAASRCFSLFPGPVIEIVEVTVSGTPVDPAVYERKKDAAGRDYLEFVAAQPAGVSVTYKAGAPVIPAVPADPGPPEIAATPARSAVTEIDRLAVFLHVGLHYLPLNGNEAASYQRRLDRVIGVNRKVGV